MTLENMVTRYNHAAFAQGKILGFMLNGELVVRRFIDGNVPAFCYKLDTTAADNDGMRYACIRFRPTKREKLILASKGTPMVVKGFNAKAKNLGEELERAIRVMYGLDAAKDSRSFTEAADAVIYGIGYEIKFDDATWTSEYTLERL